jgi:pimeloyl-ACP methyl ester carboxylesterase
MAPRLHFVLGVLIAVGLAAPTHAIEPKTEETAKLRDVSIFFRIYGDGEPLLLLHGYGSSGEENWGPFVKELAAKYKLVIPDLRGHGRSTNPIDDFTHRQAAKDMLQLLDHLGIRKAKAMGVSTGGMTLLHMATSDRDRLEAIVLIGATHYFPEEARAQMRQVHGDEVLAASPYWGDERMQRVHKLGANQIARLRRDFYEFKDSYEDMNFTKPLLSTIRARTFIVHGDRDEFFPVNIPVEMYTSIPDASLWIVPGIGHVPMFKPNELFVPDNRFPFVDRMLEFLDSKK